MYYEEKNSLHIVKKKWEWNPEKVSFTVLFMLPLANFCKKITEETVEENGRQIWPYQIFGAVKL